MKPAGLSRPIAQVLGPLISYKIQVEALAMAHARDQGILSDERLTNEGDAYFGKP